MLEVVPEDNSTYWYLTIETIAPFWLNKLEVDYDVITRVLEASFSAVKCKVLY